MDFNIIWQVILIVFGGTLLLRIAGRKTISQMTLAEAVIMISLGTLLIQPVTDKNIWITFIVAAILVLTLIIVQYVQVKSNVLEKIITGKSILLIEDGQILKQNLLKSSMTVDQLEMNLRQKNVTKIADVKWATLEPNGEVGFLLKKAAQPVTNREFQQLQHSLDRLLNSRSEGDQSSSQTEESSRQNMFTEVKHQGHKHPPPKDLQ